MDAILALEDGTIFRGRGHGAAAERTGEVVFNTSLSGYQEILTDPSYAGQIVTLTYPHIGNYGTNPTDSESVRPFAEGLVVRELSALASNWRCVEETGEFLAGFGLPAISEIDTRALVRHLRRHGAMQGVLSTTDLDESRLVNKAKAAPSMVGLDLASKVSTRNRYGWSEASRDIFSAAGEPPSEPRFHVVAYDFGIKHNILRSLVDCGCRVTVVPADTPASDVMELKPDGVFLSNGPGDPEPVDYAVRNVRELAGRVPVFGICLGHQIIGLALGGKTYKLKFGHHGGNHPVLNLETQKVEITAQNHGFSVDPDSLKTSEVTFTHINLNDQTLEGLRHKSLPLFSVQYHPEASPGPHDSAYLFGSFVSMMEEWQKRPCR
ncbi:MAG TPA: glutamine-hydrolyzing carbamoyl-phosphate synthase small subunit [Terriglobia bacterium]|nr:glutamine-hydrolyzing carbamoyl-phosphate synthase small subunit [Terriglobia bacterium]